METINRTIRIVGAAFTSVVASSRGKWIAAGTITVALLLFSIFLARSISLPEAPQSRGILSAPGPTVTGNSSQATSVALEVVTRGVQPTYSPQLGITPAHSDTRPLAQETFVVETQPPTPQSPYHYSQIIQASFPFGSVTATPEPWSNGLQLYAAAGKIDVWAVVGKSVLHTSDHGKHWSEQYVARGPITNLTFPDPQHGWMVANNGIIYTTPDGGAHWTQYQSPEAALAHVQALDFYSPKNGWAEAGVPHSYGGTLGPVYQTSDGGKSWMQMKVVVARPPVIYGPWNLPQCGWYKGFGAINFTSIRTGWVVCPTNNGSSAPHGGAFFYLTTDGGANWVLGSSAPQVVSRSVDDYGVVDLFFLGDNMHGWYSSGVQLAGAPTEDGVSLLRTTTDGGRSWRSIAVGDGNEALSELHFLSPTHGYARVWSYRPYPRAIALLETQDGGVTWAPILVSGNTHTGNTLSSSTNLRFFDADNGIAAGQEMELGALLATHDSGATWSRVGSIGSVCTSGLVAHIDDWSFPDSAHGWVLARCLGSGDEGTSRILARTTNGGRTWMRLLPTSGNEKLADQLLAITFFDTSSGYISTDDEILRTTDGGDTFSTLSNTTSWRTLRGSIFPGTHRMVFASPTEGWSAELSRLTQTTDGGKSWQEHKIDRFVQPLISVLAKGHAWVCVGNTESGDEESYTMLVTNDGGATWTRYELGNIIPREISFADSFHGWLVDTDDNMYKTNDGGATWIAP